MEAIKYPRTVTATITMDLSGGIPREFAAMFRAQPSFCPQCSFTHPSDMFRLKEDGQTCTQCGYVLKESDYWPDEIGV